MSLQVLINGIVTGALYALFAVGFGLIYSSTKIFHLAHGAVYTAAAYFCLLALQLSGHGRTQPNLFRFLMAAVGSLALIVLLILIIEIIVYRPLQRLRGGSLTLFLSSLGSYIVIINVLALLFGNEVKILNSETSQSWTIGELVITKMQAIQFLVSVGLLTCAALWIRKSSAGRAIGALSDNFDLVAVLGIDPHSVRKWALVIGSLLAGAASLLKSFEIGADLHGGLPLVLTAAVAVILGGVNSMAGTILAALLLGLSHNLVTWLFGSAWMQTATFALLLIALLFRHRGLLAARLRLEEQ